MDDKRASQGGGADDDSSSIDFAGLIHTLRRKWWIVPLSLLFTVGLAVLYIIVTPRTYRSEEVVQVEQSDTKVLNIEDLKAEDLKQDAILKTFEENLVSGDVLMRVINKLHLTPEILGLKPRDTPYLPQELVEVLYKQVGAKLERGTRLITVSGDSTDQKRAQLIAATVVNEYIEADAEQRNGVSGEANRFLLVQADELKRRVMSAEQAAQAYKDAHPGVPLDDSQNYTEEKLRDLTNRVNDARQTRIRLQSDNEQAQDIASKFTGPEEATKLLALQSVANDPAVLEAQKSLAEQEAGLAALAQRYLPKHPRYIQEQGKLREFHAGLERAVVKAAGGLGTAVAAARESENEMEGLLKKAELAKMNTDKIAIPYSSLTREVESNRTLYDSVQERLKETDITANVDANNLRIVTPASLPYKPVKPKSVLVTLAAIIVGLMLSLGVASAFSISDHSLKSVGEAEAELDLPAVGAIPMGDKFGPAGGEFPTLAKPHTPLAESFRTLRTALDLVDDDDDGHKGAPRRSFLFTSAIPGEGKSFCSVNYAIAVAQLGRKTLIVDADLRLPVLDKICMKEKKAVGFSRLLEGRADFEDCFYPTEVENLYIMPAGKRSQNPAELITNADVPAIISHILEQFDRVIIDSAPVHAVSDTLLIAKYVDATCLVVNSASTQAEVAKAAVQKLKRANAKLAGLILNRVMQSSSYYYYGNESYGEGVYEGDGESKPRPRRVTSVSASS